MAVKSDRNLAKPCSEIVSGRESKKERPEGRAPVAGGSALPPGSCVVMTPEPGALSLTETVTRVVTVSHPVICYPKLGFPPPPPPSSPLTGGCVDSIRLWREAWTGMMADNKRTNREGISSVWGRMKKRFYLGLFQLEAATVYSQPETESPKEKKKSSPRSFINLEYGRWNVIITTSKHRLFI